MLKSKKFLLIILVLIIATVLCGVPPLLTGLLSMEPIIILSGTEFASLITLVVSTYFAGNVWQKKNTPTDTDL